MEVIGSKIFFFASQEIFDIGKTLKGAKMLNFSVASFMVRGPICFNSYDFKSSKFFHSNWCGKVLHSLYFFQILLIQHFKMSKISPKISYWLKKIPMNNFRVFLAGIISFFPNWKVLQQSYSLIFENIQTLGYLFYEKMGTISNGKFYNL